MDSALTRQAIKEIGLGKSSPLLLMVRPSKECNAKCKMCGFWRRDFPQLPFAKIKEIVAEAKRLGTREIRLTGGEPLLYPFFFETLELIKEAGIESSFITNGSLFTGENIERILSVRPKQIHFSIDFPPKVLHNRQRNLPFAWENAMAAIKNIKSGRGHKPKIIVNFVLSSKNYKMLPEMFELGKGLFDELNIIPIRGMPEWRLSKKQALELGAAIMPLAEKKSKETKIRIRPKKVLFGKNREKIAENFSSAAYNKGFYKKRACMVSQFMAFIDCDGNVYPCSNTPYDREFAFGNVFRQTLEEIWRSGKGRVPICRSETCDACDPTSLLFNLETNKRL